MRGGVAPPLFLVCRLGYGVDNRSRNGGRAPRPQGRAALKTVEGPQAPPPLKVRNRMFYRKIQNTNYVSMPPHARPGDAPKGASPGLAGGA